MKKLLLALSVLLVLISVSCDSDPYIVGQVKNEKELIKALKDPSQSEILVKAGSYSFGESVDIDRELKLYVEGGKATFDFSNKENGIVATKELGNGDLTISNIDINGKLTINGGGSNSIHLENVEVDSVEIAKVDGEPPRLVIEGNTEIQQLTITTDAIIDVQTEEKSPIANTILEAELTLIGDDEKVLGNITVDEDKRDEFLKVGVAKIGNKYFETLEEALSEVETDETVVLVNDIELTQSVVIRGGKKIKIDLNGFTVSAPHSPFKIINVDVEFTGSGTIQETLMDDNARAAISLFGSTEDVANYTVLTISGDINLIGCMGILISPNGSTATPYGVVVNLDGTTIKSMADDFGVYINGQLQATDGNVITINMNNVSIDAKAAGIYAAGYAKWNLKDCTINSDNALSLKSGTFVINGGTYKSNGDFVEPSEDTSNGSVETGAAISMTSNDSYAPKLDVTINSGKFESANGYAVYEGIPNKVNSSTPVAEESYVILKINGGEFIGNTEKACIKLNSIKEPKIIYGGIFNLKPDTKYIADSLYAEMNGDKWEIVEKDSQKVYTEDELLNAIENQETVTLGTDIVITAPIDINKKVVLDLNGNVISDNSKQVKRAFVISNGSLKIKDSVGTGGINMKTGECFSVLENGELEIAGGKYTTYKKYVIFGNGERHNTKIIITDGTFEAIDYTCFYHPQNGELTISGGSFKGYVGLYAKSGNIKISGGHFESKGIDSDSKYDGYAYFGNGETWTGDGVSIEACGYPGGNPIVNITGGTFKPMDYSSEKVKEPKNGISYYMYNDNGSINDVKVSGQDGSFHYYTVAEDVKYREKYDEFITKDGQSYNK